MQDLCDRIQMECKRRGRTLGYIMAKAKVGESLFYKWRKDKANPKPRSIKAIADALGIPAVELCPEMAEVFQNLDQEEAPQDVDEEGFPEELVFIGMKKSALKLLRPIIERADASLVEVPDDVGRSLASLMRIAGVSSQALPLAS